MEWSTLNFSFVCYNNSHLCIGAWCGRVLILRSFQNGSVGRGELQVEILCIRSWQLWLCLHCSRRRHPVPAPSHLCVGVYCGRFLSASFQNGRVGGRRGRAVRMRAGPRPFRRLQRKVRVLLFRNWVILKKYINSFGLAGVGCPLTCHVNNALFVSFQ